MPDTAPQFDLQPDPRILPMLGEINLSQWKCLAELVDNSVDGFLEMIRAGQVLTQPEISVSIPTNDTPTAKVTVRDNGPGMPRDKLEMAVRAGWSGSDPTANLGLFGMGFNIATARLGTVTTVWTTRENDAEWVGLRIDFEELRRQRHFRTPALTRPKTDPREHGTEVTVERLKPEQRQWFSKAANRSILKRELSRAYSAMLQPGGVPAAFRLLLNATAVQGRQHCIWGGEGNPAREVVSSKFGPVSAYQAIDVNLPDRPFCRKCWQWLPADETACPSCLSNADVILRRRSIRGWIGIQRYLSKTEFGIDLLRHGRKIEIANKDLFQWIDGENAESEYPIDDPRQRGRIVGELHLDHCRVTYTKDRFDRTDPAWDDMCRAVRGEGPLRPDKAEEAGFGPNNSPLFKLFQMFRRSSPKPKVAGCYARLLLVPDNDRAEEIAKKFHEGDASFQTDAKWWELVEEADRQLLAPGTGGGIGAPPAGGLDGFGPNPAAPTAGEPTPDPGTTPSQPASPEIPIASLSSEYRSDSTNQRWDIRALEVLDSHPMLAATGRPWALRAQPNGTHEFLVNTNHSVFASATMTPLDALLAELAWSAMDFLRSDSGAASFASVLAELRDRYAAIHALDTVALGNQARQVLLDIATTLRWHNDTADALALFNELPSADQDAVFQRMATRAAGNPQAIIAEGRFLEYAPPRVVADFFGNHPEQFLDGNCWDDAYATLDYGRAAATQEAQARLVRYYESLFADVVWLAEQDPADIVDTQRPRLLRAQLAIELLEPTAEEAN
ncbi:MAG TPA: ATP-binding protein [Gemmataceae bacterium]|nr:ATP-binding protein [Gemmataceae bacterium]